MKTYSRLCIFTLVIFLLLTAAANYFLLSKGQTTEGMYRVEAKRLVDEIIENGKYDLSGYTLITGVYTEDDGNIYSSDEHYLIKEVNGKLYRIEYEIPSGKSSIVILNAALAAGFLFTAGLLLYIFRHIILPFRRINDVPRELAKGNLAIPIPEEKSRFFSRFTWGVNMLRDTIEENRRKELTMQRDKKLLLLSLSHDIKTPLSAIKLNAKALAKGIYKDEEKRREAAESINARADEIENFVSQITKASSEDFMNFETVQGEAFLSSIITRIGERYSGQLSVSGTEFVINKYEECILSCDPDRLAECLQNLVENAIKYGDGERIELIFDRMDGCELITVSNTGCTLDPDELPQIFESFHRGSNTGSAQGNGLGLFICRRLMTLMGGEVYAEIKDGCFCATLVAKLA